MMGRYRAIMERAKGDPAATTDHVVSVFADKIPKTHGAPVRHAVAAE